MYLTHSRFSVNWQSPSFFLGVQHFGLLLGLTFFSESSFSVENNPDSATQCRDLIGCYNIVLGATAQLFDKRKFGADLGVGRIFCGIEGLCIEYAATIGAFNAGEYYAAAGFGGSFLPLKTWGDFGIRVKNKEVSSITTSAAIGTWFMPYLELSYDFRDKKTSADIGLKTKWLVGGGDAW